MFNEKLKSIGEIQVPLYLVLAIVAITALAVYQPTKEIYYVSVANT